MGAAGYNIPGHGCILLTDIEYGINNKWKYLWSKLSINYEQYKFPFLTYLFKN